MTGATTALGRIEPLLTASAPTGRIRGGPLPAALNERYGGPLAIALRSDRPTVIANFVSTLDGVVSYNTPEAAGGGEISGFFEPDRFVMGLLRSMSDAVLIGAGTLRAGAGERWTEDYIHPESASAFAALRHDLGLRTHPMTVVVSASGSVDLTHPGLADPDVEVLIATTDAGASALARARVRGHVEVASIGASLRPEDVLQVLAAREVQLVLCEGGPHLMGQLVRDGVVDELFMTLAPQVAGRSGHVPRLSLVEGVAFDVASAPWARLIDLRIAGSHIFSRYGLAPDPDR